MDSVRQWAFAVCAAMVACGLARMLLPGSSMEKMFRITVSVFFLCCLLSPVVLQSPGLRIELQEQAQEDIERRAAALEESVLTQADSIAEGSMQKIVLEKLAEMGINPHRVTININTNGQSEPELRAEVRLDQSSRSEDRAIRAALRELGVTPKLVYSYPDTGEVVQYGSEAAGAG